MFNVLSSLVTLDDLHNYFKGAHRIKLFNPEQGISGEQAYYKFDIKPNSSTYFLKVEAVDDPSDSVEIETDKPVKELVDFLNENMPSGNFFNKMASDNAKKSHFILRIAKLFSETPEWKLLPVLRRASILFTTSAIPKLQKFVSRIARGPVDMSELEEIHGYMKSKGWNVNLETNERGDDVIKVDISGVFKAEIVPESIMYDYTFSMHNRDDVTENGITDDPIEAYQNWYRSPSVESAYEEEKSEKIRRSEQETNPFLS